MVLADAEGVFLEAEPVSRECQESVTDTLELLEKAECELGEVQDELSGAQSELRSAYTRIEEKVSRLQSLRHGLN